jgi:hypothetical protein
MEAIGQISTGRYFLITRFIGLANLSVSSIRVMYEESCQFSNVNNNVILNIIKIYFVLSSQIFGFPREENRGVFLSSHL